MKNTFYISLFSLIRHFIFMPQFDVVMKIAFYVALPLFVASFITQVSIGIMWSSSVDKLLGLLPKSERSIWLHANLRMYKAIRLANEFDTDLARHMQRLLHVQLISFMGFILFGSMILFTGSAVFNN